MTYKAKSSAIRAAKKLHGDNWADKCEIVSIDGVFTVKTLAIHDDSEATRLKQIEDLTARLAALNTPATVKAEPKPRDNTKSLGGRPIDPQQAKTRRSLVSFINAQNGQVFTVKQAKAKLKQKLQHVSNAMRWAETTGLVERVGYKTEAVKRPGRRELEFKAKAQPQQQAA
ncbi:hypothetical protein D3C75_901710 [compost metagenome]